MKFALATNDRKVLAKRTGRAKEFAIYEIVDSKVIDVVYKTNTHTHDHDHDQGHGHGHGHGEHHSHKEIIDLLKDIDLLVVFAIGKNFKKDIEDAQINYKKTRLENIEDIIQEYKNL